MQKARGNHCIKKISQVSVVHENCCKPILTIENNKREYWCSVFGLLTQLLLLLSELGLQAALKI
jgi:hypothetical protein